MVEGETLRSRWTTNHLPRLLLARYSLFSLISLILFLLIIGLAANSRSLQKHRLFDIEKADFSANNNIVTNNNNKSASSGISGTAISGTSSAVISGTSSGLGALSAGLFWFVQVSDVHISRRDRGIQDAFRRWCLETVPAIDPRFVMFTGDATESIGTGWRQPAVTESEFWRYGEIVNSTGMRNRNFSSASQPLAATVESAGVNVTRFGPEVDSEFPFWIDIRGNHDTWGVPALTRLNPFTDYSVMGQRLVAQRNFTVRVPGQNVTLFFFDATPRAGMSGNLFGVMTGAQMRSLRDHLSRSDPNMQHILVGHYTLDQLYLTPAAKRYGRSIYDVLGKSKVLAYLSGHFHLRGMYARHPRDLLELEVADFKFKRMYRVVALDNGLMSFADAAQDSWPVVVVTNPKDARTLVGRAEPVGAIRSSSHVRVLIFPAPNATVTSAEITIDGVYLCSLAQAEAGRPLWTCPWGSLSTLLFGRGVHTIKVAVRTSIGSRTVVQPFSLDGSAPALGMSFSQFLSHVNIPELLQGLFLATWIPFVSLVLVLPKAHWLWRKLRGTWAPFEERVFQMLEEEDRYFDKEQLHHNPGYTWRDYLMWQPTVMLWQYGSWPHLPWAVTLAFFLNLGFGLWWAGFLVSDWWGFVICFSLYHRHELHPVPDAWLWGCVLLVFLYLPVPIFLSKASLAAHGPYHRAHSDCYLPCRHSTFPSLWTKLNIGLFVFSTFALNFIVGFTQGITALFLNPAVLWWPVVSGALLMMSLGHVSALERAHAPLKNDDDQEAARGKEEEMKKDEVRDRGLKVLPPLLPDQTAARPPVPPLVHGVK
jgi:hypothetical protein